MAELFLVRQKMSIGTILFISAWMICAFLGAAIGYAKNRLALGASLGAAGGLIGVAIIACIPKKEEKKEPPVLTTDDLLHDAKASLP